MPRKTKKTDEASSLENSPENYEEISLQQKVQLHRKLVRSDLYAWCAFALSPMEQSPARHHQIIIDALEDVTSGHTDRLMLSLPPGSAKSTYASILFPAWWLANNPHKNVILASHSASLAEKFSKDTRDTIMENATTLGINIRSDEKSIERWKATNGATFRCVGVGGSITGFRADLIICDDLVRGRAEADSPSQRDSLDSWYRSNLFTRLKPGGKIIVIGTRWNEDDISGRLLSDELKEWRVIRLPALCDDPQNDALGRTLGEPLWPEWQNLAELQRIRATVGEREFSALYQQNPVPMEGLLIDVSKFTKIKYDPLALQPHTLVRAWDIAATAQSASSRNPDFTCGVLMAKCKDGKFIILDVVKIQGEPATVEKLIIDTAIKDGKGVSISIPQDPGAGGKHFSSYMTRQLSGWNVETSREVGTKTARATPFIAQANNGNILLKDDAWNRAYTEELECFPAGLRDDQVDATSRAFNYIVEKTKRPIEYFNFNIFDR